MRSSNFGSITAPMGVARMRPAGMPRISMGRGRGTGVPSLGGLGVMKLAAGGLAEGGHPSMSWLAVRDTLRGMPSHTVPDYMLARMRDGGNVSAEAGRRAMRAGFMPHASGFPHMADGGDPLDYAKRGQGDVDRAMFELERRPVRQPSINGTFTRRPDMPNFSPLDDRLQRALEMRDAEESGGDGSSMSPSDIPMMMANPRRMPLAAFLAAGAIPGDLGDAMGTAVSGPMMGGLSALLHAKNAGGDDARSPRLAQRFDPRVINARREYSPFGMRMRRLLGSR